MQVGKDIINKPVISINNGKFLGNIKDVYFDHDLTLIIGLFMGREGIVRRKDRFIPRAVINVFGLDAVLVHDHEVLTNSQINPEVKTWIRLQELRGRDIDTSGGTRVGVVADIAVDETAKITDIILGRTFVAGPVAKARQVPRQVIQDLGHDAGVITIDLAAAEQFLTQTDPLTSS